MKKAGRAAPIPGLAQSEFIPCPIADAVLSSMKGCRDRRVVVGLLTDNVSVRLSRRANSPVSTTAPGPRALHICSAHLRGVAEPHALFVEPDVFHAPAVENAVDHDRHPLDVGLLAGAVAVVEDDRPGVVLG